MIAFDHLVIYSSDPEQHQSIFSSFHNQVGVEGGHHENWGTFNYLAFMKNNSYIEWIGVDDDQKASESDNPLIQHTYYAKERQLEGPIQFALRVENLQERIDYFNQEGIEYEGPFPGSRKKPDGTTLAWKMLFPKYDVTGTPLPFLLEWSGDGNVPTDENLINPVNFSMLELGVPNPEEYIKQIERIYQLSLGENLSFQLENGTIKITHGNHLKASFEHITFKSK
ncbi:VOC family protein [Alkalibacillus aidingensis]|uniref:VOC family protein n=1 Tax=Alkalibacillus aidingensis TaxID=2747607 RepID=UPI0016607F52|nr:VOC family protein [Alkalibacillus aidingensis]